MQKVRVAIDRRLAGGSGTGVASYARALEAAVDAARLDRWTVEDASVGRFGAARGPGERTLRWLEAWWPGVRPLEEQASEARLWRRDVFRLAQVRFRRAGSVLRLRAPGPPGIMHWSYPVPATIDGWINVYTVHDVIPLERPDLSAIDPALLRRQLGAVAAAGGRLVTVSDHARRSIERVGAGEAVNLGGAAVDLDAGDAVLPGGLTAGGYLLFCGLFEPRKNLDRLTIAWVAAGRPLPLVLAGPDGDDGEAIRRRATAAGALTLPYQPRTVLVRLIGDARALVFPSLAEGFGLPVIEAMALGVSVITSRGGALEEVAGGAAWMVDPLDEVALSHAIHLLAQDDAVAARLVAAGHERARAFTVDAFGERLASFYAGLVADRVRLA